MARGGRRTGTPGTSYQNRTDLNLAPKAATGLPYGEHKALIQAQQAVPLQSAATPAPSATPPVVGAGSPALPGQQDFTRATERPAEPVTAGLPIGAGPGPEVLQANTQPSADIIGAQLRAIYAQYPNNDLLRVLQLHDQSAQ